jgi:hypothetical protein
MLMNNPGGLKKTKGFIFSKLSNNTMLSQSFLFFYRKALKMRGVKLFFLHHYFKPFKKNSVC